MYAVHLLYHVQVKFVMSDETTLEDLLALNLHEVEDDVRNIVDKATKELSMEKTLKVCGLLESQDLFQLHVYT